VAQKKQADSERPLHGQLALMLCESLLHELVESGVISKAQALNVIDTVVELVHEGAERDRRPGAALTRAKAQSATVIIEAIRKSFAAKGTSS
jgi:hypothetical protein